jgi:hypothetical protein
MFNHYVRLFSKSALVMGDAQKFSFADSEIIVWDSWRGQVHEGLTFSVRLTASGLHSSMKNSLPTVAPLANMLAITHSTAIDDPQVIFGMDLDSAKHDRQFGQVIYNVPSQWLNRREFDKNTFAQFLSAFVSSTNDPELIDVLNSGMFHLRQSFQSTTLLDEFFELYSGLESLNPALQRKYNLPTMDTRYCACGAPITTPIASGIRHAVFELTGKSKDVWKTVRNMRVDMIHRHGRLPNVTTGLYDNVLVLREALPRAIFDLMDSKVAGNYHTLNIQKPAAIMVSATLKRVAPEMILGGKIFPRFELLAVEEVVSATSGRSYEEPFAAQLTVALRDFDGACDSKLDACIWTGKYYDLPKGTAEDRHTEFIARLSKDKQSSPPAA